MTTSSVLVPADWDLEKIARQAGSYSLDDRWYQDGILYVRGVSQAQLDAAFDIYDHLVASRPRRISDNNAAYEVATKALTADYPQLEKDTWPTQDQEAGAWVGNPDGAVTPWVDRAASERGIDREEYLRRTLVKAKQFKILSAFLTGRRQRYEDAIKGGGDPVLDYALTPDVMADLQQVARDGMTLPADQLRTAM